MSQPSLYHGRASVSDSHLVSSFALSPRRMLAALILSSFLVPTLAGYNDNYAGLGGKSLNTTNKVAGLPFKAEPRMSASSLSPLQLQTNHLGLETSLRCNLMSH